MRKHFVLFFILLLIPLTALIEAGAVRADVLSAVFPAEPESLDPHKSIDPGAWTYIYPCYQRLTALKDDSIKPVPSLAVTWRISDDGAMYTFVLKQGLSFSDGIPVNARAVRSSFQRAVNLGLVGKLYFPDLLDVQELGPYTVRFILKQPSSSFLRALAFAGSSIVSPSALEHPPDYLDRHTLGSGPYELKEWLPGEKISLTSRRNQAITPSFKRFDALIEPESNKRMNMLADGRVRIAGGLAPDELNSVSTRSGLIVYRNTGFTSTFLAFNCQRPWLKEKEVRRALSMAINVAGIMENVKGRAVRPMHGPVPLGMWGRRVEIKVYEYLPYTARELIKNLGPPQHPLDLLITRDALDETQAKIIVANFKSLGIKINPVGLTPVEYELTLARGNYDLALGRYTPKAADPVDFLDRLLVSGRSGSSINPAHYQNPEIDDWLNQAARVHNRDDLFKLLVNIMNKVIDDAPYIFMYQTGPEIALSDRLKNFTLHPALPTVFPLERMNLGPAGSHSETQKNIPIIIEPESRRITPR